MAAETRRLLRRATACFQAGDYAQAEPLLLEVIRRTPFYANVYNMLGFIYSQRNAPERAVELFRRALNLNPNYTEARLNLAITLADMGASSEASAEYGAARAAESPPGSPAAAGLTRAARNGLATAHADLARMYRELGRLPEAIREFDEALALCPDFADLHYQRGVVCREQGDQGGALASFARALEINPGYVEVHLGVGLAHHLAGDHGAARRAWEKTLELDPANELARLYLRLGEGADRPESP